VGQEVRLKKDIQQCIANNSKEYSAHYNTLVFDKNTKKYTCALGVFEELKITPDKENLLYELVIADDIIETITEEEMNKLKRINWVIQMDDVIDALIKENVYAEENDFENNFEYDLECEDDRKKFRKPKQLEIDIIKTIKRKLKKELNLDLKYEVSECFISLNCEFEKIIIDKNAIRFIIKSASLVDVFSITAKYDDNGMVTGVRFFWGISLEQK
jgi:hypothetical protein